MQCTLCIILQCSFADVLSNYRLLGQFCSIVAHPCNECDDSYGSDNNHLTGYFKH